MIRRRLLLTLAALLSAAPALAEKPVSVGSKKFTESVLLGEIARLTLQHAGISATHRAELGGTRILWNALRSGDIDVYAEYTGTLSAEIFKQPIEDLTALRARLAPLGLGALAPLGFNDSYAIGMSRRIAESLGIRKISDLAKHPQLKLGFGEEFRLRPDGWAGLRQRYRLPQRFVRGLDHDIAYRALQQGDIQVTDLYSTDAEIQYYDLVVLEDDLAFFPRYEAIYLYRLAAADAHPELLSALGTLSGQISDRQMSDLNRQAKLDKVPSEAVAAGFLRAEFQWDVQHRATSRAERLVVRSKEHLKLVLFSLLLAIAAAIPLGLLAEKKPRLGRWILWSVGIIQTIPALALLVILIRPLNLLGLSGIGDTPALIALFLYSLLPIVRSTHSGFQQIPLSLRETAAVLGLGARTRLFRVELPLALPLILSGIKTSAVINVGFATLGALVGAGGYGQPILTGIRLDDYSLILEGAVPAALLAIFVQQLFDALEVRWVSPGLRK